MIVFFLTSLPPIRFPSWLDSVRSLCLWKGSDYSVTLSFHLWGCVLGRLKHVHDMMFKFPSAFWLYVYIVCKILCFYWCTSGNLTSWSISLYWFSTLLHTIVCLDVCHWEGFKSNSANSHGNCNKYILVDLVLCLSIMIHLAMICFPFLLFCPPSRIGFHAVHTTSNPCLACDR